jgi:archaemetzincin
MKRKAPRDPGPLFAEIQERLRGLAEPLPPPDVGDWLAEHPEPGQTFDEYRAARPVRRDDKLTAIYTCAIGPFTPAQQRIVELTRDFLGLVFDVPVRPRGDVALDAIPDHARRPDPWDGDEQILTTYVLHDLLLPDRPADALAYLALTATDLWPRDGWNFVYGQANLRERVGVWSLHRNGDPDARDAERRLCLRRTLLTAAHETGHVLTLKHCVVNRCLMNGSNHEEERDRKPLHLCPVCLRKLVWNLRVEPVAYLRRLEVFCREHGFEEATWYATAADLLAPEGAAGEGS